MQAVIASRFGRFGRFVWSAWAGLAGLSVLAAVWQVGHDAYGDFILPSPSATVSSALLLLQDARTWAIAGDTTRRAIQGFVIATVIGGGLGIVAGYSAATLRLVRPILTVVLGVPPIAWIVLAMIWFGSTDGTAVTTVLIATIPLVFVGAAEGVATRDRGLDAMARAFGAGPVQRFLKLGLRHTTDHVFPAMAVALGTAFKVAVMAELLANVGGVGGALASARANLDVSIALAWVMIAVGALMAFEYGLVHPIRAEFDRWREAARPWGVKR